MTHDERAKLIAKISVQLFTAKRIRQGVVLSHQLTEALLNELKSIQRADRGEPTPNDLGIS